MTSLEEFVEKLDCADEAERIYAAEDIGYLNSPDGVPALLRHVDGEPSRAVREAIFQALTRIEGDAPIQGAIRLLASDDPQIRNQAVEVLRQKGAPSVPFLSALMHDADKDLRKLVLDVLSGVESSGAEAIYRAALGDPEPNVVITAVENLGRTRAIGFRQRIEALLLGGSHPMLDGACLEALAGVGNDQSMLAIRQRFPELGTLPDFFLVSCLKAIGALGTASDAAEVARLLGVRAPHLRPAILGALIAIHQRHPIESHDADLRPALEAIAADGGPPLGRYQAVRALGSLFPADDVYAFLIACLSSGERMVRLAAIESLRETARPGLEAALAACALQETDEEVQQALSC